MNLEDMVTLGFWFYICMIWISREETLFPVGGGTARPRPGAEKHGLEWRTLGWCCCGGQWVWVTGPGMLGKKLIFYAGNGALWKTTAGEGREASRGRMAAEAGRGTGLG